MAQTMTDQMFNFFQERADLGGPVARANNLPVSAMLACASVESRWGQGNIYRKTLNPLSLQKWPHVHYPTTYRILWFETVVQTNPKKTMKAPFVCATDRADAVCQWCEWILHYGNADGPPGNPDPMSRDNKVFTKTIKFLPTGCIGVNSDWGIISTCSIRNAYLFKHHTPTHCIPAQ